MQVWLITIKTKKAYSGNVGYADKIDQYYQFDNLVQNSKRISVNDTVVIRQDAEIIGVSVIEDKKQTRAKKILFSCPKCNTTKIRKRKTEVPTWACSNSHFFDTPTERQVSVDCFVISYGANFQLLQLTVPWKLLTPFFTNTATQSIRPINRTTLINTEKFELAEIASRVEYFADYTNPQYTPSTNNQSLSEVGEEERIYEHEVKSSSWTGIRSQEEVATSVCTFGPQAIQSIQDWLHYIEFERNDPNPPEGFPDDLLEQLKALHDDLGMLLTLASENPRKLDSSFLAKIADHAKNLLAPTISNSQLLISGACLSGARMTGGLAGLKALEVILDTQIPITTGPGATIFAAGVAASTFSTKK